jgi:hypothetical protein
MNISGPAAVAKPEMLFYAPGDLTVTEKASGRRRERGRNPCKAEITSKPTANKYELAYCGLFQ